MQKRSITTLEQKEKIDEKILEDVARILKVPSDAIKNLTENSATKFFNTFNDQSGFNYQCTFNPLEKYIEAMEEIKNFMSFAANRTRESSIT